MLISVILCTRNRAASLARTLESLATMHPISGDWELLIVDNGSGDNTPEVVESFGARLPISRVVEKNAGLSNARNKGVSSARGKYLLWTDDDVLVDQNWLKAYETAFMKYPEAAVFGGLTEPVFLSPITGWMQENTSLLTDLLAIRNFGDRPVPLTLEVVPFGLNYCIRRAEQLLHLYDPNLGVAPGRRMGGEETAVIQAILANGHSGYWLPDPKVLHLIPPERQTRNYVRHYYESLGEAGGSASDNDYSLRLCNVPRWRLRRFVEGLIMYYVCAVFPPVNWLPYLIEYSVQKGWIRAKLRH